MSSRKAYLIQILAGCAVLGWTTHAWAIINAIQSLTPATVQQGSNSVLVKFSLNATPPPPPTNVAVRSVTIGSIVGTFVSIRTNQYQVYATFNIPGSEPTGIKPATILYGGGAVTSYLATAFTVTAAPLAAQFSASPTNGSVPLTVTFSDASTGTVTNRFWAFGDGGTSLATNPVHTYTATGLYSVSLTTWGPTGSNALERAAYIAVSSPPTNGAYAVVDTGQTNFFNDTTTIPAPAPGQPFYGQDAQFAGRQSAYRINGDGTVSDLATGLMWVQARGSKVSWDAAFSNAAACAVGGYTDWRMPTIKELYSLVQFSGENGQGFTSTAGYSPFINTNIFGFAYGSGVGDERVIDCQDWSATPYVSTTMHGDPTVFGVNFADGRIKGYPRYDPSSGNTVPQTMYVRFVRSNTGYGINRFVNNGDGTISDKGTRLMWAREDSGVGLAWSNALAWVQTRNAAHHLGYSDWRLPTAKEMQSILDYTRSPDTTGSPAINPLFSCSAITNEAGQLDYPYYYTSTTLVTAPGHSQGIYLCFGRAMGYMNGSWLDVHGAGAQRSDPKAGSLSSYTYASNGYYSANSPQGDAIRIANFARLVRDIPATNAWRFAFVGDTHTPLTAIPEEIAASVLADDARVLIVAGDLVESGAGATPVTLQSQLTQWRTALTAASANGVGVYVLRGNHEADVPGGLATWNAFSDAMAMPTNGPVGETGLSYAFTCENALFIGLDNYVQIHRVNQPWLNAQLTDNTRPHLFVFGHEPAFKTFHTDCLDDYPDERNAFWNSLSAAGARVYLCGHDHLFNVARIDDGDGNPNDDLYQYVVGTGGTTNWPPVRYQYTGSNTPFTPVNIVSATNTYGYLLGEVSGTGDSDRLVTFTWRQRTYDAKSASYLYVATGTPVSYTAPGVGADSVGDGIPNLWRWQYFGGDGSMTNSASAATSDADSDGMTTRQEYLSDTDPTQEASCLRMTGLRIAGKDVEVGWSGGVHAWQCLETSIDFRAGPWLPVLTNTPPTPVSNTLLHADAAIGTNRFYRLKAWR